MPNTKTGKRLMLGTLMFLLLTIFNGFGLTAEAAGNSVVINEVAWAGSADSANDEWVELYNNSSQTVDLTGWKLKIGPTATFVFPASSIGANGYFLIERAETAVSDIQSDAIFSGMSLVNTGTTIQLLDSAGAIMDTVNNSGGAWYAGSTADHSTMERIDPSQGDIASNFASSTRAVGLGRSGGVLKATPKQKNSVANFVDNAPKIFIDLNGVSGAQNEVITLPVMAQNLTDLFAYGIEIDYDPALLQFQQATAGNFLSASATVATSFQSGLLDNQPGKIVIAEARTVSPKVGRSGSGELFNLSFKVLAPSGSTATLSIGQNSFASDVSDDLTIPIQGAGLTVSNPAIPLGPVTNLQANQDQNRYAIKLDWTAPQSGADSYLVERKNSRGVYVQLGTVSTTAFIDNDNVVSGGKIIPQNTYFYRVTSIKGGQESSAVEVSGLESRGLKGDNDRSDLVDGRDLQRLAEHFAETDNNASFDALVDTTYDGRVDGSDLIDIGANFASKY